MCRHRYCETKVVAVNHTMCRRHFPPELGSQIGKKIWSRRESGGNHNDVEASGWQTNCWRQALRGEKDLTVGGTEEQEGSGKR